MIKVTQLDGVEIPNPTGLPSLPPEREADAAMGSIPGWSVLIDPDTIAGDGFRNVAQERFTIPFNVGSRNLGEFDNGEAAQVATAASSLGPQINRDGIDPNRFTIFTVAEVAQGPTSRQYVLSPFDEVETAVTPTVAIIRLTETSYQLAMYEGSVKAIGQNTRVISPSFTLPAGPHLFAFEFSIENGLRVRCDGVVVSENTEDKRPLNFGYGEDEYEMFFSFRGKYGMTGILNRDMGDVENTADRKSIERFLMAKYGIPQGA